MDVRQASSYRTIPQTKRVNHFIVLLRIHIENKKYEIYPALNYELPGVWFIIKLSKYQRNELWNLCKKFRIWRQFSSTYCKHSLNGCIDVTFVICTTWPEGVVLLEGVTQSNVGWWDEDGWFHY